MVLLGSNFGLGTPVSPPLTLFGSAPSPFIFIKEQNRRACARCSSSSRVGRLRRESVDPSFPAIISKTSLSRSPWGRLESFCVRWPQKHSSSREVLVFDLKSPCWIYAFVSSYRSVCHTVVLGDKSAGAIIETRPFLPD